MNGRKRQEETRSGNREGGGREICRKETKREGGGEGED